MLLSSNKNKEIDLDMDMDMDMDLDMDLDKEIDLDMDMDMDMDLDMDLDKEIDLDRESTRSPFDRTRMDEYLMLNNDKTYFRSVFDGLIFNINELELEKQYHIILFLRDLLDYPKNQNGDSLSEAELFEYINKMICNEGGYYQSDFFRRLWVECVVIGSKSTPKFSA
jgi:hypothetical protein